MNKNKIREAAIVPCDLHHEAFELACHCGTIFKEHHGVPSDITMGDLYCSEECKDEYDPLLED